MSKSVLLVEDSTDWSIMLAGLIGDVFRDIRIVTAPTRADAEQQLSQQTFDLAIIDIRLDDSDEANVDGLLLMDYIAGHYQMPVLVITGYPNVETVTRAMRPDATGERKAYDYVPKSKVHIDLLPRLRVILGDTG